MKGYGRKGISPRCMLKIDMQKAYDSVEWDFLEQVLACLNVLEKFVKWIMVCVTTMPYSIIINGKPISPFPTRKGLRRGDPLSPYLFVLAMEYFNRILKTLKHKPDFNYHPKCAKMNIIQLGFADDLLLFCRGDVVSVQMLYECFESFSASSGLMANIDKSSIFFGGVGMEIQQKILSCLGFTKGESPIKYLRRVRVGYKEKE